MRSAFRRRETYLGPSRIDQTAHFDPNVWAGRALQEVFIAPADNGLASMYPASDWSVCSGPSWISARLRSDYRTGLDRAIWVTSVRMRREDRSSIVVSSSRRPRRAN